MYRWHCYIFMKFGNGSMGSRLVVLRKMLREFHSTWSLVTLHYKRIVLDIGQYTLHIAYYACHRIWI